MFMIDWPNLLAGAVLGFLLGLVLWVVDHRRASRQRKLEARIAWMSAAKDIELAAFQKGASTGSMYTVRVKYPVDLWRSILGPDDFLLLERLEENFMYVESAERIVAADHSAANLESLTTARGRLRDAKIAFANMARGMQDESYNDVMNAEERKKLRHDFARHPLRTLKRERQNRKMRRQWEKAHE